LSANWYLYMSKLIEVGIPAKKFAVGS